MKLNIPRRTGFFLLLGAWVILITFFYSPITSFVNEKVLENFRPVASVGKVYDLSLIAQDELYGKGGDGNYTYSTYVPEYDIGSDMSVMDGRAAALRKFLLDQNSPLMPYAELIVKQADQYKLDWRLVVSISGIESKFCRIIPEDSYNCWGWRGGPGGTWQHFGSYEAGIKVLTKGLAQGYGTNLTPFDIEPAYDPPAVTTGHDWAKAVTSFMNTIDTYLDKSRVNE